MNLTEKQFQKQFVEYLRQQKWTVFEQVRDQSKTHRADVIGFRSDVGIYIGFELKINRGIITYTKALKQIINYQRTIFPVQPSLWCIVTQPENNSKRPVRFLWRFGVGVCWFPVKSPIITYINGLPKDTVFLDVFSQHEHWRSNNEKNICRLADKIKMDYVDWNV